MKNENIATLIRRYRVMNSKSQAEIGAKLGISGQFISNCERAVHGFPPDVLKKITTMLLIPEKEVKEALIKDKLYDVEKYFDESVA